jgi:hypothetical protein
LNSYLNQNVSNKLNTIWGHFYINKNEEIGFSTLTETSFETTTIVTIEAKYSTFEKINIAGLYVITKDRQPKNSGELSF